MLYEQILNLFILIGIVILGLNILYFDSNFIKAFKISDIKSKVLIMSKKIFSGVQPTGNLHLGNYLGAIKNFVELKMKKKMNVFFVL